MESTLREWFWRAFANSVSGSGISSFFPPEDHDVVEKTRADLSQKLDALVGGRASTSKCSASVRALVGFLVNHLLNSWRLTPYRQKELEDALVDADTPDRKKSAKEKLENFTMGQYGGDKLCSWIQMYASPPELKVWSRWDIGMVGVARIWCFT
jgi:hypothetical protein